MTPSRSGVAKRAAHVVAFCAAVATSLALAASPLQAQYLQFTQTPPNPYGAPLAEVTVEIRSAYGNDWYCENDGYQEYCYYQTYSTGADAGTFRLYVNGADHTSETGVVFIRSECTYYSNSEYDCSDLSISHDYVTTVPRQGNTILVTAASLDYAVTTPYTQSYSYSAPDRYVRLNTDFTNNDSQQTGACAVSCFAADAAVSTVPYISQDSPRSLTIVYHGDQLAARPFVFVDLDVMEGALDIKQHLLRVTVDGAPVTFTNGDTVLYYRPSNRLAAQFDARAFPTGPHRMQVTVRTDYTNNTSEQATDSSHQLLLVNERKSPVGRGWSIAGVPRLYVQPNVAVAIVEGDGSATLYTKTACDNNQCTYAAPVADFSRLTYRLSTAQYTRSFPDSSRETFNGAGQLLWRAGRAAGDTTRFAYSGSLLTRVYDPYRVDPTTQGQKTYTRLDYDGNGLLAAIREPGPTGIPAAGRTTSFYIAAADSSLRSASDPGGGTTYFTYDDSTRLETITNRRNETTRLTYHNQSWKLASIILPATPVVTPSGVSTQSPTTSFVPWQIAGVPTAHTDSAALAISVPPNLVKATVTDAGGHATSFTVDRWGQPLDITMPSGSHVFITRDGPRPTSVRRENWLWGPGVAITYSGPFVTSVQSTGQQPTYFHYGAYGQIDSTWGPGRPYARSFIGIRGRIDSVQTRSAAGTSRTKFAYDALDRVTTVSDPENHQISYQYDDQNGSRSSGNRKRVDMPGGRYSVTTFDGFGRDSIHLSNSAPADTTTYDVLNRVVRVKDGVNANPTVFTYDSLYLLKVLDPKGQEFAREVNALGWVTRTYDPTGRFLSRAYDIQGRVAVWTNRQGQSVTFAYDSLGRVISKKRSTTPADSDSFGYSADGFRMVARNAVSTDSIFASPTGWTDSVVTRIAGQRFRRYYQPNALEQLQHFDVTMSPGNLLFRPRNYYWNAQTAHVDSIDAAGYRIVYARNNEQNRVTTLWKLPPYPGAATRTETYSTTHQLISSLLSSDLNHARDLVYSRRYGIDSLDRVVEAIRQINTPSGFNPTAYDVRKFTYTGLGEIYEEQRSTAMTLGQPAMTADYGYRVAPASPTGQQQSYRFDAAGNRTLTVRTDPNTGTDSTASVPDSANRVVQVGDLKYVYDIDGRVIRRYVDALPGGRDEHFVWSVDGRMLSDSNPRYAIVIKYDYNALGQLVRRTRNGIVDRHFLWDGDNLLAELDGTGAARIAEYSFGSTDEPLAILRTGSDGRNTGFATFYQQDAMGNVIGAFDTSADTTTRLTIDYADVWGNVTSVGGTLADTNRLRWKGLMWEGDITQLYYVRSRWYDPQLGRFISEDPIGIAGGANVYSFAANDPVNGADPSGLGPYRSPTGYAFDPPCPTCIPLQRLPNFRNIWKDYQDALAATPVVKDFAAVLKTVDDWSPHSGGMTGVAQAEAGYFGTISAAASGAIHAGVFFGSDGVELGGTTTTGTFVGSANMFLGNPDRWTKGADGQATKGAVVGYSAGAGAGLWISNAQTTGDLKGRFNTLNINTFVGSGSIATDGKIWQVSWYPLRAGVSGGASVSSYPTRTRVEGVRRF